MATQLFVNGITLSDGPGWAKDADNVAYSVLTSVSGTNTILATGPAGYTYAATTPPVWFIPAVTNTAATTINITPSGGAAGGAKNIFSYGAACVGGELKAGIPVGLIYDGTQYHIMGDRQLGVVQRVYSEYTANADLTTVIPYDDTIPQITEGTEIFTGAITPKSATNRIRIRAMLWGENGAVGGDPIIGALFVDATAGALAAVVSSCPFTTNVQFTMALEYEESAASTTARTYRFRLGPASAATIRLNGKNNARRFGGVSRCTLIVEEIA